MSRSFYGTSTQTVYKYFFLMQSTFHLLLTLDKPSEHFQVLSKVRLTKSCCWNPALFSLSPSIHSVYIFQMGFYKIMCKQSGKNRTKTGHCISFSVQSVRELTEATGGAERESCPVEHTPAAGGQWSPRKMIGKTVLFFYFFGVAYPCSSESITHSLGCLRVSIQTTAMQSYTC